MVKDRTKAQAETTEDYPPESFLREMERRSHEREIPLAEVLKEARLRAGPTTYTTDTFLTSMAEPWLQFHDRRRPRLTAAQKEARHAAVPQKVQALRQIADYLKIADRLKKCPLCRPQLRIEPTIENINSLTIAINRLQAKHDRHVAQDAESSRA